MHSINILLADDMLHEREIIRALLTEKLKGEIALNFVCVESAEDAVAVAESGRFPIVLLDIDFSSSPKSKGMNGLEASKRIKENNPEIYSVVISSNEERETMSRAVLACEVDWYLRRSSISYSELASLVKRALLSDLHRNSRIVEEPKYRFITSSTKAKRVLRQVDAVQVQQNVLIYGETGTGKELIARRLHANAKLFGPKRPLRILDCASLPAALFEGEVFGYKKGAFTGALSDRIGALKQADGGDLFLDEIQNIPVSVQQKLLRVLNDGVFSPLGSDEEVRSSFRIIAATNLPVEESIKSGRLMPDFVERIRRISINLLPLRERPEDIPPLALISLRGAGKIDKEFLPEALEHMAAMPWRGNVRELKSFVEMIAQNVKIPFIGIEDVRKASDPTAHAPELQSIAKSFVRSFVDRFIEDDVPLADMVEKIEEYYFSEQIKRRPTVKELASTSGYNRNTLSKRLERMGLKKIE